MSGTDPVDIAGNVSTIHEMTKPKRETVANGVCEARRVDPEALERAAALISPDQHLGRAADMFKVLAHPARLKVLQALDGEELCVCDLAELLGLSMSGTSQQLRELRRLGAIDYRVSGKFAFYRLADRFWLDLARTVLGRVRSEGTPEGFKQAI